MRGVYSLVVLAEELGAFPLGPVPENDLGVIRILVLGQLGGHATEVTPGPGQWLPSRQRGGTALPGAIHEMSDADHRRIVETNLLGPMLLTGRVVAQLRRDAMPGETTLFAISS